ncbi:peptide methionine sulfoxide reductase B5-like [Nicotiana sylvestris]|uniref:Peptide methionine sulfoxide reductase B5-like n=1 Tax=Nicotiana sylvestris TaxID=4096 RepID=A0A1U7YBF3_NICSY|nr:PREDICTED: peptide methionine sulfoxide reductase B5-like [Nicotiana sylvestris]
MIEVIQLDGLTMWLIKLISSFFLEIEETMIVQILGILFIGNNAEKLVFHRLKGTGEYNKFFGEGNYNCAGCGTPLYKSTTKFDSGCGWPAFFEGLPGITNRSPNPDGRRTEITCAACGGHLGHVFKGEGFKRPTDERHCVNSVSVKFNTSASL